MSSVFLAPICLVTQPPGEARGKREWAHSYAGGQGQGIQDYFGPNVLSGDGDLRREEPGLGIFG